MKLKSLSRKLRRQATDVEHLLWNYLRARQLAGFKFRRQVVIEPYIVDFACFEARLIIEADGGQHVERNESDAKRTVYLESLGYRVIRFWNHEILEHTDAVLEQIQRALINIPSPRPSPEGRGGQALSNAASSQLLPCSPSVPEGGRGQ